MTAQDLLIASIIATAYARRPGQMARTLMAFARESSPLLLDCRVEHLIKLFRGYVALSRPERHGLAAAILDPDVGFKLEPGDTDRIRSEWIGPALAIAGPCKDWQLGPELAGVAVYLDTFLEPRPELGDPAAARVFELIATFPHSSDRKMYRCAEHLEPTVRELYREEYGWLTGIGRCRPADFIEPKRLMCEWCEIDIPF